MTVSGWISESTIFENNYKAQNKNGLQNYAIYTVTVLLKAINFEFMSRSQAGVYLFVQ